MAHPTRPASAHTPDGRPLQQVTTYARRGSRLTPGQRKAWDRCAADWLVPADGLAGQGWEHARWFGREAPLVVEVGSGVGETVAAVAAAEPDRDFLAVEVWKPGVAATFQLLERAEVGNVRLLSADAVWCLEHVLAPGQVTELWTFFPDPWPKKRHHKRRLVNPRTAALVTSRLAPGGRWRLATDWADYAEQMDLVLAGQPGLSGGRCDRWPRRPRTKFERRAQEEGREVTDFCFRRTG